VPSIGIEPDRAIENACVFGVISGEKSAIFRKSRSRLGASFNMAGAVRRLAWEEKPWNII
jgi:hypothetical protein